MPVVGRNKKPNARDIWDALPEADEKVKPPKGMAIAKAVRRMGGETEWVEIPGDAALGGTRVPVDPLYAMLLHEAAHSPDQREFFRRLEAARERLHKLHQALYDKWGSR